MYKLQEIRNSQRWCFTINNFTEADLSAIHRLPCLFLVYGKEHLTEGTPHIQGYVEFQVKKRTSTVCKALGGRAHCEVATGTAGENIEYCTKEKNYYMTDKELEASYHFYDEHPLPEHWTKQERYEWKALSNHEHWTEDDLKLYIQCHENYINFILSRHEDLTRKQLIKQEAPKFHYEM